MKENTRNLKKVCWCGKHLISVKKGNKRIWICPEHGNEKQRLLKLLEAKGYKYLGEVKTLSVVI
jgi:translation initiation factor 1 (eIF-1/SUI1)